MTARTANVTGTRAAASRALDHRKNRMLQAVAPPKQAAFLSREKERLLEIIKQKSLLKGKFKLASGAMSDYYLDMKPTTFDPEGANLIADIVYSMLESDHDIDAIGGLEVGS